MPKMWPFSKIARLEERIDELVSKNEALEKDAGSNTDELEFLRDAIKDYVVYKSEGGFFVFTYRFYAARTLKDAESDIAKLRLYISVLEGNLGKEKAEASKATCCALMDLCSKKAELPEGASQ